MERRLGALFISFLLALTVAADSRANFVVETYPPGAEVYDYGAKYLGLSGQPISLAPGNHTLTLRLENHEDKSFTLGGLEIQKGRYPESGVVALRPLTVAQAVKNTLRYRWYVLLLGTTLVWFVVRWAVRQSKRMNEPGLGPSSLTVGAYQLFEQVGRGGMSEVYRARRKDDPSATEVAVKIMHLELTSGETVERFRREIKAHLALTHRNLPALMDWGEHSDGRLYLVMELLEGETLKERLKREGALPDDEVIEILTPVAAALDHLHAKGFVHRDVKSSNVFCLASGGVKLTDMGIAQHLELSPLTQTSNAIGTPHYMAPEQVVGQAVPASDQYSLGVMAFEMLAGRRPFISSDAQELLRQQLSETPHCLSEFRPDASVGLQDAVARMLSKNPKARYHSCEAAATAIRSGLQGDISDDTLL